MFSKITKKKNHSPLKVKITEDVLFLKSSQQFFEKESWK